MEFDETGFALFTSGVWESDGAMVSSIGASNLIVEPHGRPPDKERQANLALIAQAPAMYELLKQILVEHDSLESSIVPVLQAARIEPPKRRGSL